jgi:hypothetical protein
MAIPDRIKQNYDVTFNSDGQSLGNSDFEVRAHFGDDGEMNEVHVLKYIKSIGDVYEEEPPERRDAQFFDTLGGFPDQCAVPRRLTTRPGLTDCAPLAGC